MPSIMLPKKVANSIDRSLMRFRWGFDPKKVHNFTPKSWLSICRPKSLGGLGIRNTSSFNEALLCKLGWSLLNKETNLWVSVISNIYMKNWNWQDASINPSDSPFWKGLLKLKYFLAASFCK